MQDIMVNKNNLLNEIHELMRQIEIEADNNQGFNMEYIRLLELKKENYDFNCLIGKQKIEEEYNSLVLEKQQLDILINRKKSPCYELGELSNIPDNGIPLERLLESKKSTIIKVCGIIKDKELKFSSTKDEWFDLKKKTKNILHRLFVIKTIRNNVFCIYLNMDTKDKIFKCVFISLISFIPLKKDNFELEKVYSSTNDNLNIGGFVVQYFNNSIVQSPYPELIPVIKIREMQIFKLIF
ncbi:hypothetical protein EHI8A_010030 [Entamoeba histolytica HM-1:IMSS-B]|uniref:Uncharacterized protein n=5 Tax=Entamoeba histolytica TaxID=5759 RepID=C4M729_ENTH1|nr:hypothetical protein EHI_183500 [Entamoeba histolytica HM-1:IMSS]EMH75280.1 hypothetical protein EHI8A_010030 [Entamoeba histolytica HM-1:IMSS-B]EMS13544.1 hypothetical protein KM1_020520 [Entamoeba histolytica HM-3:IMSS]ENY66032.1 hypothetical protein EHI7A_008220 [Entamoeba histolytica HM-1:IMSS-A]GAT97321.1 hypothetical protein CL6EHI_183500 [Entamoeba histolytica]EAL48940.1 hypothetical protein EHI_183500 [Entamoeba histolytica HM-1:IMSS]|eukprot:XP_654326.1 hypothetical protein EHI_183500 [Entamoeba histolytica HM-1:IMSS]